MNHNIELSKQICESKQKFQTIDVTFTKDQITETTFFEVNNGMNQVYSFVLKSFPLTMMGTFTYNNDDGSITYRFVFNKNEVVA